MLKVVEKRAVDESEREVSALDRLARDGARRMLEQALEAEVDDYIERFRSLRDSGGRALVVRNGRARARTVVVGAGVLDVRAPGKEPPARVPTVLCGGASIQLRPRRLSPIRDALSPHRRLLSPF